MDQAAFSSGSEEELIRASQEVENSLQLSAVEGSVQGNFLLEGCDILHGSTVVPGVSLVKEETGVVGRGYRSQPLPVSDRSPFVSMSLSCPVSSPSEGSDRGVSALLPDDKSPVFGLFDPEKCTINTCKIEPKKSPESVKSSGHLILEISDISDCDEVEENRFGTPLSDSEMEDLGKRDLPPTTRKSVLWAVKLFEQWRKHRNRRILRHGNLASAFLISKQLESMSIVELNFALARFIVEVRKTNGAPFPPKTVRQLILLLQMRLHCVGKCYKLLSDRSFESLQNAVDNVMKRRAEMGLGLETKKAEVIDNNKEEFLWKTGILGSKNPQTLSDTMVFLIGLNFALRSGDEHRSLTRDQLKLCRGESGDEYLLYTEKMSKTNRRGLRDYGVKRKEVKCFPNLQHPDRCLINLYKKYISLCPVPNVNAPFYLQPLRKPKTTQWYGNMAIGRNTLYKTVKRMCSQAGFKGKYVLKNYLKILIDLVSIYNFAYVYTQR